MAGAVRRGRLGQLARTRSSALSFAAWAPLAFELADALLLLAIFRLLTERPPRVVPRGRSCTGLSPGSARTTSRRRRSGTCCGSASMAFVVVRWLLGAGPPPARAGQARAAARAAWLRAADRDRAGAGGKPRAAQRRARRSWRDLLRDRRRAPAHALRGAAGVGALALLDLLRPRWLLLVLAAIAIGYLAPRYDLYPMQYGGLFSGVNPSRTPPVVRASPRGGEAFTARIVHLLAAACGCSRPGRDRAVVALARPRADPGAAGFSPFVVLFVQSYGGEAIYRVFLFSAPWCALLIAGAAGRAARSRLLATAVAAGRRARGGGRGPTGPLRAGRGRQPSPPRSLRQANGYTVTLRLAQCLCWRRLTFLCSRQPIITPMASG